ncbi:MAG: cysteine desulfurase [Gammaproteobacteria bacterium]|nr:cysteine desulfurase [Gammaproteobacteria bacterium]
MANPRPAPDNAPFDVAAVRADFPVLDQTVHDCPLAFLDNAASAQRPRQVIDAISHYYRHDHANVHRGVHTLSHRATDAYEGAREKVRAFLNAQSTREIVFTRGTTEAINLLASSLGQSIAEGDEILITHMEHHSNIVPWQLLCERTGAVLRVVPIDQAGELLVDDMLNMLNERTRLVGVVHVSNALGTINPVETIIKAAHDREIPVLLDGAQATAHMAVDVQALGCEFYALSGHKMCGPTGIGVLYGREDWLQKLPPYQGGGEMILSVSFADTVYNKLPYKFEAGTPHIAGAIGLGAAIDYLTTLGMDNIAAWESQLLDYLTARLAAVDGIQLIGTAAEKAGVQSFNIDGIHPHDLGTVLDHKGVAIRTGHHCAMPVMEFFGVAGTARASLAFYNTPAEIDQLIDALAVAQEILA